MTSLLILCRKLKLITCVIARKEQYQNAWTYSAQNRFLGTIFYLMSRSSRQHSVVFGKFRYQVSNQRVAWMTV